jgi:hypothetical protein
MAPVAIVPFISALSLKSEPPRVEQLSLASLTLDEKISLLSGRSFCDLPDIKRLSIPSLKVSDGPSGEPDVGS